jgi:hypothetical protein
LSLSQAGTFLFDCSQEREVAQVQKKTVSLWTFVEEHHSLFVNPRYKKVKQVLWPKTDEKGVRLWTDYYARWHHPSASKDSLVDTFFLLSVAKQKQLKHLHEHSSSRSSSTGKQEIRFK